MKHSVFHWCLLLILVQFGGAFAGHHAAAAEATPVLPDFYAPAFRPTGFKEFRAPLSEEVQFDLWRHQNPNSCDGKQFAVLQPHQGGIGSLVHVAGAGLGWAWNNNRIMLFSADFGANLAHGSICGHDKSLACFFEPLSNCSAHANPHNTVLVNGVSQQNDMPKHWEQRYEDTTRNVAGAPFRYWWRGQSSAYIMRLNAKTSALLQEQRLKRATAGVLPLPLPDNAVSIHVRHGDKAKEMKLHSWSEHEQEADRVAAVNGFAERFVFLSTEDPAVVKEVAAPSERWHVVALEHQRSNEDYRHQISEGDELFLFSLENLFDAIEAWYFVGTRGSNWNRLIDELRAIWPAHPVGCCSTYAEVGCKPAPGKEWCDMTANLQGDWRRTRALK
ncbi:unnamed protein product [Phaeothamnion confervicola]